MISFKKIQWGKFKYANKRFSIYIFFLNHHLMRRGPCKTKVNLIVIFNATTERIILRRVFRTLTLKMGIAKSIFLCHRLTFIKKTKRYNLNFHRKLRLSIHAKISSSEAFEAHSLKARALIDDLFNQSMNKSKQ